MRYSAPFFMGIAAPLAAAHTTFTTIYIDDVTQGDGTCVRMNMNAENSSSPIPSLSSDDMACGSTGETAVAFTCPAAAGAKLTFEWRMWADLEQEGALDPSHKGPCAVYVKPVTDMSSTAAAGSGWFKIWDEGYDNTTGKWCTDKLIDDGGLMSVQIPDGLPAGNYLFRPELLALHNANAGDPQFYTGCAQIQVQGSNAGALDVPADYSVSIPGYVKDGDASVSFNIYNPVFPYPMPGPSVYAVPAASSTANQRVSLKTTAISGAALVPSNCLCKEANWCGVEVADYSTEDGCWKASEDCYNQAQVCYDSVPPTGNKNCQTWEGKCKNIQDACSAGIFNGPPNKGQKLDNAEARQNVVVPAVDNLGSGSTSADTSAPVLDSSSSADTSAPEIDSSTAADSSAPARDSFPSAATTGLAVASVAASSAETAETIATIATIATSSSKVAAASATASISPCEKFARRRRRRSSKQ